MNTLNETFKNVTTILSLIWSVGRIHEHITRNH
jgi:hypothetical protein